MRFSYALNWRNFFHEHLKTHFHPIYRYEGWCLLILIFFKLILSLATWFTFLVAETPSIYPMFLLVFASYIWKLSTWKIAWLFYPLMHITPVNLKLLSKLNIFYLSLKLTNMYHICLPMSETSWILFLNFTIYFRFLDSSRHLVKTLLFNQASKFLSNRRVWSIYTY